MERGKIAIRPSRKCELCGKIAETRPYGPRGEEVCFECGMRDEEASKRQFRGHILGDTDG